LFRERPTNSGAVPDAPHERRAPVVLALCACVAAAFILRAWALWARQVVDYDEMYYYILGRNLVTGKGYVLNGLPHTAFPPLYPMAVGLASLFSRDVRFSTSLVTALAGALLPVPIYLLGRDVYGRRAGLLAAAAAAVWPALFFFSGKFVPYERRLYCGSEALYVTLAAAGGLFLWRFARSGGWGRAVAAGAFFGLASLVRSEGPVVFAFLFLWLLVDSAVTRTLWSARRLAQAVVVAIAMLAVLSPFLVHVRMVTGRWSLGAKLANNVRIRDTLWDWSRRHKVEGFFAAHYRLSEDNSHMVDPYWGVSGWHRQEELAHGSLRSGLALVTAPDWRWLRVFAEALVKPPNALVPWYAWLFIIAAIAAPPWGETRYQWWAFAAAVTLAMALLAVSLYVLPRHELLLVALAAVELGRGIEAGALLVRRAAQSALGAPAALGRALALLPAAGIFAAMTVAGVQANLAGNSVPGRLPGLRGQEKDLEIARWLEANIPPGSTVMCNQPWIAVWAGMDWRVSPSASPSRIADYAVKSKIDFAVLAPWQLEARSGDASVLESCLMARPGSGGGAAVYDFRKAARQAAAASMDAAPGKPGD